MDKRNNLTKWSIAAACGALVAAGATAQAQFISSEPFSGYSIGTDLPEDIPSPPVVGYSGDWIDIDFGDAEAETMAGSLVYGGGYFAGSGDHVGVSNNVAGGEINSANSGRTYRLLDGSLAVTDSTAGTLYLSWLFQSGQETGATTYQMLDLYNSNTADGNRNFTAGLTSNGGQTGSEYDFGVDETYYSTGVAADTNVHLFVVKFDLSASASSDGVTVWLDPTLGAGEPVGGIPVSGVDITFDRLAISDYDGNSAAWDEIRWGETFDAVTVDSPVPSRFLPVLSASPRFLPAGQIIPLTVTIPTDANASSTVMLTLTNENSTAVSLPGGNPTTLTFNVGATNVQVLNVSVVGSGLAKISVVTNATFLGASISLGTPISVEEPFEYTEFIPLDGLDGGIGFSSGWSTSAVTQTYVTSPGLTWPGLLTSSNAGSVFQDTALRSLQGSYGGVGGGTVWVGFLIHDNDAFVEGANFGGFSLLNDTAESMFMGLTTYATDNGKYGFTVLGQDFYNFANSVAPATNTAFLVYRIDFPPMNGGTATVTFYANPAPGDDPPFAPTGTAIVENFSFDRIRISTDTLELAFDEIRIGSSWTNVAPVFGTPPPPTPLLSAPTRFGPVGQDLPVTLTIPPAVNQSSPASVTLSNDNPGSFSLSPGDAGSVTLDFAAGATNVQTFDVSVTGAGAANLTVVSNAQLNTATISVASQVSAVDPFEYTTGLGITGNGGGGSGWGGLWGTGTLADQGTNIFTGTTELPAVVAGLTYPGLLTSSNALNVKGATATQGQFVEGRTFRPLDKTYGGVGGGTVWASFLIQGGNPFTWTNTLGNFGGMSLFIGDNEEFLIGLSSYEADNGNYGFMRVGPTTVFLSLTNSVPPSTNVTLLVTRLDFPTDDGGSVGVTFYADPAVGGSPPAVASGQGSVPNFTFDTVRLACDNNLNFDEVRIGGNWSEVVPSTRLNIEKIAGNQVQLSWPSLLTGFGLQSTTAGVTGGWGPAGLGVVTTNGLNISTDSIGEEEKYYRLHRP